MSNESKTCPQCGSPIPDNAPGGFCPKCLLAGAAAVGTGILFHAQQPIVIVGLADLAATVVIFIFSVITNNSSMYDPYWSVAPVPIALFWLLQPGSNGFANPRHVLIFALLCLWAIRLTTNWATQWRGLDHEDWRYQDIQKQTGILYWPAPRHTQ